MIAPDGWDGVVDEQRRLAREEQWAERLKAAGYRVIREPWSRDTATLEDALKRYRETDRPR